MVRTQIQLTEAQAKSLKRLAATSGKSMAQLVRLSVEAWLQRPRLEADEADVGRRARAAAGRFRSKFKDVSRRHDRHLAEILGR